MASLHRQFFSTSGSIIGRDHVRCQRNNQDGVALRATDESLIAVVADGCSSGRYSEVGARLGSCWLAEWAPFFIERRGRRELELALYELTVSLLRYLSLTADWLRPANTAWAATLQDYFLFTFLVSVVNSDETIVFGIGDGVYSVNGDATVLDSGPRNAPPYVAYNLVASPHVSESLSVFPELHYRGPTDELRSLIVATDGANELVEKQDRQLKDGSHVGGLLPFEREPRYLNNASLVHKRLVVIGEGNRCLQDDTTVALIRRRNEA